MKKLTIVPTRKSPIAGSWYAGYKSQLIDQIVDLFKDHQFGLGREPKFLEPQPIFGAIVPHAGFMYSGPVASHAYGMIKEGVEDIDTVIILGPNHQGWGPGISVYPYGSWETPLGKVPIDTEVVSLFNKIIADYPHLDLELEKTAHSKEHSIEIQLPFLQYILNDNFNFVPICIADQKLSTAQLLAKFIDEALSNSQKNILFLASTDLSHEYDYRVVEDHDQKIIEAIESKQTPRIDEVRKKLPVRMCGYGPVYTLLELASLNNPNYTLQSLKYSNSSQITGRKSGYSVGYYAALLSA